jgi:hypothetical protein
MSRQHHVALQYLAGFGTARASEQPADAVHRRSWRVAQTASGNYHQQRNAICTTHCMADEQAIRAFVKRAMTT